MNFLLLISFLLLCHLNMPVTGTGILGMGRPCLLTVPQQHPWSQPPPLTPWKQARTLSAKCMFFFVPFTLLTEKQIHFIASANTRYARIYILRKRTPADLKGRIMNSFIHRIDCVPSITDTGQSKHENHSQSTHFALRWSLMPESLKDLLLAFPSVHRRHRNIDHLSGMPFSQNAGLGTKANLYRSRKNKSIGSFGVEIPWLAKNCSKQKGEC